MLFLCLRKELCLRVAWSILHLALKTFQNHAQKVYYLCPWNEACFGTFEIFLWYLCIHFWWDLLKSKLENVVIFALIFQKPCGNLSFGWLTAGFQANPMCDQFNLISKCAAVLRQVRPIPGCRPSRVMVTSFLLCDFPYIVSVIFFSIPRPWSLSSQTLSLCPLPPPSLPATITIIYCTGVPLHIFLSRLNLLVNIADSGF